MATILLVEESPDLVLFEARLLEAAGHRVIRCNGAPSPLAACPMLRYGDCPLPDTADLIVFDCSMSAPMRHRSYRGDHLARGYREHPRYGRLPMLIVGHEVPGGLGGSGAIAHIPKFSEPHAVLEAVAGLLA